MNLSFEVANDEGLIASYTITNIEKSNLLQENTKAYQVSLFNNDKAVGLIKYQVDWIKNKWDNEEKIKIFCVNFILCSTHYFFLRKSNQININRSKDNVLINKVLI